MSNDNDNDNVMSLVTRAETPALVATIMASILPTSEEEEQSWCMH